MKRIIILVTAVLIIFGLSSCMVADWMLGVLYPIGDCNIHLIFNIDDTLDVDAHPAILALIPIFKDQATGQMKADIEGIIQEKFWSQKTNIEWSFMSLSRNQYRVIVYYDKNDDGKIQVDEPSTSLKESKNKMEVFDFTMAEDITEFTGNGFLGTSPGIDSNFLKLLIGGDSTTVIASFSIQGPGTINAANLVWEEYTVVVNDTQTFTLKDFTYKLMKADDRTNITAETNKYSPYITINFGSISPTLTGGMNLILSVDATLNKKDDINQIFRRVEEMNIAIVTSDTDPSFYLEGPNTVPSDATKELIYSIKRNNASKIIQSVQFQLSDNYGSVGYNGNWGWTFLQTAPLDQIKLAPASISPMLSDPVWTDNPLILSVWVHYNDNTDFFTTFPITIVIVGGGTATDTVYDINVAFDFAAGEDYFYELHIVDRDYGNDLVYPPREGITSTYGYEYIQGIIDPVNAEQVLVIIFEDADFNQYPVFYDLQGQLSGYHTYSANLSGIIETAAAP